MGINIETEIKELKERLEALTAEQGNQAGERIKHYAEQNPWQVAGIALAVGFLAAYVATNSTKKK